MELTDVELVAALREGDGSAAAVLVERHRPRMRAVAVAMLGWGPDIDDVVQDAMVLALSKLHTVHAPEAAGAWLGGLTRNLCRQALAQRARSRQATSELDVVLDPAGDPAVLLDVAAHSDWVWQAIDGLSDPLRHAVVLRYFSRASSYDAIAVVLGVPVGTVRSRLSEARRILNTALIELADAAHAEHRQVVAARTGLFTSIYAEYNRGARCGLFRSALTADADLRPAGVTVARGRERIGNWLESDIDLGVQVQLFDVIAGADVTVVEGAFVNPPDHPDHCPTATTHVYLHDGDGIRSVRLYYAGSPDDRTFSAVG